MRRSAVEGRRRRVNPFGSAPPTPLLLLPLLLLLLPGAPVPSDATKVKLGIGRPRAAPRTLPNQAPAGIQPAPRVFYNRISKAGSTTMLDMLNALQKRNGFTHFHAKHEMYYDRLGRGWNEATALDFFKQSRSSPAVYDCHTFFVDFFPSPAIRERMNGDVSDFYLINVFRNPVQRYRSRYYYSVDPVSKGPTAFIKQRAREADPCGCAGLSFNDCVAQAAAANSSCSNNADLSRKASNILYFLSQDDFTAYQNVSCNPVASAHLVRKAMAHMEKYAVIGLTERMHDTMALLEQRLPAVFAGAVERLDKGFVSPARVTQIPGHILAQGPLVSAETEAILRANPCNQGEFALWEHAKWLFHRATGVDVSGL
eukprot:jgi/Tetstr1/423507/TSEL_014183.t1